MRSGMDLETAEIAALVVQYLEAASAHGRGTESGDHASANAAYEQIARVYRELRRRGPEAQRALIPLLANPDLGVRSWAGAHALEFAPAEGEPVLLAIAETRGGLVSFSAKTTLRVWREGNLRFP